MDTVWSYALGLHCSASSLIWDAAPTGRDLGWGSHHPPPAPRGHRVEREYGNSKLELAANIVTLVVLSTGCYGWLLCGDNELAATPVTRVFVAKLVVACKIALVPILNIAMHAALPSLRPLGEGVVYHSCTTSAAWLLTVGVICLDRKRGGGHSGSAIACWLFQLAASLRLAWLALESLWHPTWHAAVVAWAPLVETLLKGIFVYGVVYERAGQGSDVYDSDEEDGGGEGGGDWPIPGDPRDPLLEPLLGGRPGAGGGSRVARPETGGVLSRLVFWWVGPMMAKGTAQQLEVNDLYSLPREVRVARCSALVWDLWTVERDRAAAAAAAAEEAEEAATGGGEPGLPARVHSATGGAVASPGDRGSSGVGVPVGGEGAGAPTRAKGGASLLWVLCQAFGRDYFPLGLIKLANDSLGFAAPLLLHELVAALDTSGGQGKRGARGVGAYALVVGSCLGGTTLVRALLGSQYDYRVQKCGMMLRSSVTGAVYRQAVGLTMGARAHFSAGEVQTLMSVDADRVVNLCQSFHELWSLPMQIAAALALLYTQVRFAFLAGLAVAILLIPVNKWLAGRIGAASEQMMSAKDRRIRATSEAISHLRLLKLHCWEGAFSRRIGAERAEEMRHLATRKYLDAGCVYFWASTQVMFSVLTFGLYALLGHTLDAATVFTSMALFNILIGPLNSLPWVINGVVEALVSLRRLQKFLATAPARGGGGAHAWGADCESHGAGGARGAGAGKPPAPAPSAPPLPTGLAQRRNSSSCGSIGSLGAAVDMSAHDSVFEALFAPTPPRGGRTPRVSQTGSAAAGTPPRPGGGGLGGPGGRGAAHTSIEVAIPVDDFGMAPLTGRGPPAVAFTGGAAFEWQQTKRGADGGGGGGAQLRGLNLAVPSGAVCVVTGPVGAGKSTLLCAALGELPAVEGAVETRGRLAYVAQTPWVHSGSLRDNVVFGQEWDEAWYRRVLEACALGPEEVGAMGGGNSGGEGAEISEKGSNLSGGQRARVSLARALYQDADVYILDDPFASLDAHVAAWVAREALGKLLQGKTVLVATHQLVPWAHMVVRLEGGRVGEVRAGGPAPGAPAPPGLELDGGGGRREEAAPAPASGGVGGKGDGEGPAGDGAGRAGEGEGAGDGGDVPGVQPDAEGAGAEEARQYGHVRGAVYLRYARAAGWGLSALLLASLLLMQATRNGSDMWLAYWVGHVGLHPVPFYLKVFGGIAAANSVVTLGRSFLFAVCGLNAARDLHDGLLGAVLGASPEALARIPAGRVLNRFSSDQCAVDDSLPFIANILLANAFSLAGLLAVLCATQPALLALVVPLAPLYASLQKYYRSTSRELRRLDSVTKSPIYQHFGESLAGAATIRALQQEGRWRRDNERLLSTNLRASLSELAAAQWLGLRLQLLASAVVVGVCGLALAGTALGRRHPWMAPSAGGVGLALSYALPMTGVLNGLLSSFTETEKEMISVERVGEYLEGLPREEEEEEGGEGGERERGVGQPLLAARGEGVVGRAPRRPVAPPPPGWPRRGQVQLQEVVLRYTPGARPALDGVSFNVLPGRHVGVCGRTGAGKSSILVALTRLHALEAGRILVDGMDARLLPVGALRAAIAVIPQEPFLFEGTVRENLDPEGRHADVDLCAVLRRCHVASAVEALAPPGGEPALVRGLGARVREGGQGLSLGQQQLLCLARALLRRCKVLCLDEATASVDEATAQLIAAAVEAAPDCAVIQIAHRVPAVLACDEVVVMEGGRVAECGPPSALLRDRSSALSRLAAAAGASG